LQKMRLGLHQILCYYQYHYKSILIKTLQPLKSIF